MILMKNTYFFIFILILISSCSTDESIDVTYSNDYGKGTYFVSENSISFISKGGDELKSNIFQYVNQINLSNNKSSLIYGQNIFIIGNELSVLDINTFELLGTVSGFSNAQKCAVVTKNRVFVTDKDESLVKEVNLNNFEIISEIETGANTSPSFIINKFDKSFVLNSGSDINKDSTIVTIKYKDDLIPLAEFSGNLIIGDNPNSAITSGNVKILCKGVYDVNNSSLNTESSFYNIYPNDLLVNFSETLSGIYNAQNLVENTSGTNFYFTAEGGIYRINQLATNINPIISINTNLLKLNSEKYIVNDSTDAYSNMLYMNDLDNLGKVYKYNINLSIFVDTISLNSPVVDISFKN